MSLAKLLVETKTKLPADIGTLLTETLSDYHIDIMPDPRPKPTMGKWFAAIYGTSWRPGNFDPNSGIEEVYGMGVTVTMRQSAIPRESAGLNLYIEATLSLDSLCRTIMTSVHQNTTIGESAGNAMTGTDRIVEYFRWAGTDPQPRLEDGTWLGSERPDSDVAYVMEVRFDQATRYQSTTNMV